MELLMIKCNDINTNDHEDAKMFSKKSHMEISRHKNALRIKKEAF